VRQRRVAQLLVYLRPNNQSNSNLTLPTHSHNVREIEVFFGPPADRKVRREHVVIIWYPVLPRPIHLFFHSDYRAFDRVPIRPP